MDICAFINSPDIAEYLRDMEYEFNSLETAWLIYQCRHVTLEKKFEAWDELIATMSDCPVSGRPNCEPRESLHEALRQYMALLKKGYQDFTDENPRAVYRYSFYCAEDQNWSEENQSVYVSLDEVWREIELDMDLDIRRIRIKKEILGEDKQITVEYNGRGEITDVAACVKTREAQELIYNFFDGMWFQFPVPFEKGDILIELRKDLPPIRDEENGTFVLKGCTAWDECCNDFIRKCGDTTDMCASGHFQNDDGTVYDEVLYNYMDLTYYKGPFDGTKRFLKALGNFEKGKIGVELLLCAYRKVILDKMADDVMLKNWFDEEALELAGLKV